MALPPYYLRLALQTKKELDAESEQTNWDRRNTSTGEMYCVHGQYLGTWDGPDYMCGWCEEGSTHYEVALYRAYTRWENDRHIVGRRIRDLLADPDLGGPRIADVLHTKEVMVLCAFSLFVTGDLKRDITNLDQALEALT